MSRWLVSAISTTEACDLFLLAERCSRIAKLGYCHNTSSVIVVVRL